MRIFNNCLWTVLLSWTLLLAFICYIPSVKSECSSHQFKCANDRCIPSSWECDEDNDCSDNSDEQDCKARTCTETEFRCENGKCIPKTWQCDREDDCKDNSDEVPAVCHNKTCAPNQFTCGSLGGECIPNNWRCDGQEDCKDGSDEKEDCNQITCTEDEFTCENNKCITLRWICDQDNDCGDHSDEKNCPNVTCSTKEFMCETGKCIPDRWRCDGSIDCTDKSDEANCVTKPPTSTCNAREFTCANNKDCIHIAWQCDGDPDCPDKSDELNCNNTCRPDQFQCRDLHCIPGKLQCNGQKECQDGSDEERCEKIIPTLCDEKTQFDCGSNNCIALDLVCNKKNDCGAWEDEPSILCNKNECEYKNGDCSQICIDMPIGYRCDCYDGYKLVDNRTCEDINECDVPGSCSQICVNTKGSYKCECIDGYLLEPNNSHRCRAVDGHLALIFANRHDIRKFDLETEEYLSLVDKLYNTIAVDYVFRTGTLVWSDSSEECISSAPIDTGKPITTIVNQNISIPDGIAVDWIYGHIYWTDTGKDTIDVADMTGKMRKTLIKDDTDEPRAIVVNPLEGWMFWTDWGEPAKIERAGMDGSHRQVIVSTDIKWPNGLAVDFVSKRIFWVDAKLHLLSSADYNGGNRQVILSSNEILQHPFSIDVFEDWIYWTDWQTESIHRINKFTGKEMTNVTVGIYSPMDVHIYHPYKQPDGTNFCDSLNGRCSHLCLPAPNITERSARFSCACPNGMTLMKDMRTCVGEAIQIPTAIMETITTTTISTTTATNTTAAAVNITTMAAAVTITTEQPTVIPSDTSTAYSTILNEISSLSRSNISLITNSSGIPYITSSSLSSITVGNSSDLFNDSMNDLLPSHIGYGLPDDASSSFLTFSNATAATIEPTEPTWRKETKFQLVTVAPPVHNVSYSNYSSPKLGESADGANESDTGKVAGIIIGVLGGLAIITTLIAFFMYKQYLRKNVTSMNFDNPVYRKTTEDQFSLEKNQYQPARSYPPSMEPLTSPGTNEFV